jgi:multidrug resistance efflux pump
LAQLAWRRTDTLSRGGSISLQESDERGMTVAALSARVAGAKARMELLNAPPREDDVRITVARIAAAKAKWELSRVMLQRCELRAPQKGQILQIDVQPGELIGPDSVSPAIILADTSRYRVRAFVEELDAPRIIVGMKARITSDGLAGCTMAGVVSEHSPRMNRKRLIADDPSERHDTRIRDVLIELESKDKLIVGMRVDVEIDPTAPK